MNHLETGEAPEAAHGNSDLRKELAEVLRQRAAISAVLRAIANSPHDLQPIFDSIIDSAVHLCRAELGSCIWPRKKAFVSLHINRTLQRQSGCRQCFWNTAALLVASSEASRRSTSLT